MDTQGVLQDMKLLNCKCPKCNHRTLYLAFYEATLKVLKQRFWHICHTKGCGYEKEVTEQYLQPNIWRT